MHYQHIVLLYGFSDFALFLLLSPSKSFPLFLSVGKVTLQVNYRRRSRDGGSPWWTYVEDKTLVRRRKAKE